MSIGSFLINYLALPELGAFNEQTASTWVSYYWGGAMLGRFAGALITRYINALLVLAVHAVVAIALLLLTMNQTGMLAAVAVISIGFFNSIMFPTIFTHGINGLGSLTSRGSGLLCQAIVGGALVPLLQGVAADSMGVQHSFVVPLLAYVYIAGFAVWHWRAGRN